jgi:hypothetical protein
MTQVRPPALGISVSESRTPPLQGAGVLSVWDLLARRRLQQAPHPVWEISEATPGSPASPNLSTFSVLLGTDPRASSCLVSPHSWAHL